MNMLVIQILMVNYKLNINYNLGNHLNLITQFDCLRSKCYNLKTLNEEIKSKCKGVKNNVLKQVNYNDFVACNYNGSIQLIILEPITISQECFLSQKHSLYTIEKRIENIISNDDEKRIMDTRFKPNIYTVPIVNNFNNLLGIQIKLINI